MLKLLEKAEIDRKGRRSIKGWALMVPA